MSIPISTVDRYCVFLREKNSFEFVGQRVSQRVQAGSQTILKLKTLIREAYPDGGEKQREYILKKDSRTVVIRCACVGDRVYDIEMFAEEDDMKTIRSCITEFRSGLDTMSIRFKSSYGQ